MRSADPQPRHRLLLGAAVVAALCCSHPLRATALTLLRLPFTIVKTTAAALILLPRLPSLAKENAALRQELVQRQLEAAQLRERVRQTGETERLLQAAPSLSAGGLIASIIGRSPLPTQQTVLLDKGSRQGLTPHSIIMDASGVIGRVVDVQPQTALVLLLTDPESRLAALVERSRETGLLVGRAAGQCELRYLGVEADVQPGDRVVTAGLGGPFPKGLVLGTVARIVVDEQAGMAVAYVEPAAQLSRLEEVLCLPASGNARQEP